MQITRQTDYAVRCVLHLSGNPQEIFTVGEISKKMNIPKSFLAKILQRLVKSGIVKSIQGVKGGFQLSKKPRDISLLDVIETIEGPVAMNRCAIDKRMCSLSNSCSVHPVWVEIRRVVEQHLRRCNFAQLASFEK